MALGNRWEYRLIHKTRDPFDLFSHEPCYFTLFLLGIPYKILILTIKSILWVEQFYLFPLIPTGAVLFVPFKNKWSSSICSEAHLMAQFYLFRRTIGGAVLFVPVHIKWSSSICSGAYLVEQFYLFRSNLSGAVLFMPVQIQWNSSICSGAHITAQFYLFHW